MADVLFVPPDPKPYLADAKSATSVHDEPSQDSVSVLFGCAPPNIKVEVLVPDPPKNRLAVFTSVVSVHDDPFQDSTFATAVPGGVAPADAKAAVELPEAATCDLAVLNR